MDNNLDEVMQQLAQQLASVTDGFAKMSEVITSTTTVTEKSVEQEEKDLRRSIEQSAGYTRINGRLVRQEEQRIELEAKLNKELEQQFGSGKLRADKQEDLFNQQLKQLNYMIDSNGKLAKTTIELNSSQQKLINNVKKLAEEEDLFNQQLKQLNYMLDSNGKLAKTTVELNAHQQNLIKTAKKLAEEEERRAKSKDNIIPELKKGLLEVGKASWGVASGLAKGETSFTTLFPLIESMGNAIGGVTKSIVGAIPVIGGIASAIIDAGQKIALEGSKLILQILEKTLKDFQEIADAGGLVSGGMTSLFEQLKNAGMTTEGFKKVVKESATTLTAWKGTVGEGARQFSAAVGELSLKGAGDDLRKLGFTADQMGESAAAFLEQEIRLGRGRNMTQKQLIEGTVQYAKELDLLQKVTGLSRQDAQKQRDELLSDSRYRASIEGMNKQNQNGLNALMMKFRDPTMKRGLMDLASGSIATKDAGMVVTAFGDTAAEAIQSLKDADPKDIPKVMDKIMLDFEAAAKNNKEMFGEAYKYLEPGTMINAATIFDIANGKYVASMVKAKETQDAQIENTDDLTKSTVKAQKEMELLSKNMLTLAETLLPKAAEAVEKFTTALNDAIKGFMTPGERPPSITPTPTVEDSKKNREEAEKAEKNAREKVESTVPGTDANIEARKAAAEAQRKAAAARAAEEHSRRQNQRQKGPADSREPDKKKTAEQLIKFSSGTGDKAHFDMLEPDVRDAFMRMVEEYGKPVQISSSKRSLEEQQALWDKGQSTKDENIRKYKGLPVVKPGTSRHEKGKALDLAESDVTSLKSTASSSGEDLLKTYGFKPLAGDPVHIDKARFGGVFDGPESGYPVILHGEEAVVPKPDFTQLKQTTSEVSKSSLSTVMPSPVAPNTLNDPVQALKSLHNIMSDKFDQMITIMERGNDLQYRILNNSMV